MRVVLPILSAIYFAMMVFGTRWVKTEAILLTSPFFILGLVFAAKPTRVVALVLVGLNVIALAVTVIGGLLAFIGQEIGSPGTSDLPGAAVPFALLNVAMIVGGLIFAAKRPSR